MTSACACARDSARPRSTSRDVERFFATATPCGRRARRRSREHQVSAAISPRRSAPARPPRPRVAARRPTPCVSDVAVRVEDVVDDLEEQPELVAERAPRRLLAAGTPAAQRPSADRRPRRGAGLQPVQRRVVGAVPMMSRYWPPIIPSVASASSRATCGGLVRGREPERLGEQRVAGEEPTASPYCAHWRRPRRSSSLSSAGRSSWTSEKLCTSSSASAAGQDLLRIRAGSLAGREGDHRPDALAAASIEYRTDSSWPWSSGRARVARGLLDELPLLLRASGHRPPPSLRALDLLLDRLRELGQLARGSRTPSGEPTSCSASRSSSPRAASSRTSSSSARQRSSALIPAPS